MTYQPQYKAGRWKSLAPENSLGNACRALQQRFPGSYSVCLSPDTNPEQKTLRILDEKGTQVWPVLP